MSIGSGATSNETNNPPGLNTSPSAPRLGRLVSLSADDWNQHRDTLVGLYRDSHWSPRALDRWMRRNRYQTSEKSIRDHLRKWGVLRRNLSSSAKEEHCRQIYEALSRNEIPSVPIRLLKKLRLHCEKKSLKSESERAILDSFARLEISATHLDEPPSIESDPEDQHVDGDIYQLPVAEASTSGQEGADLEIAFNVSEYDLLILNADVPLMNNAPAQLVAPAEPEDDLLSSWTWMDIPCSLITQPAHINSNFKATHNLFHLSRSYYSAKLLEHPLLSQEHQALYSLDPNLDSSSYVSDMLYNKRFWNRIKSGIYYLKMRDTSLARRAFDSITDMIPRLCERQPLPLLKEMHGTLSPLNTSVFPSLRVDILREFRRSVNAIKLDRNHPFFQIVELLFTQDGSDELSINTLQVMLKESKDVLAPTHPEIYDMELSMVRFHRRKKQFITAANQCEELVKSCESRYGNRNHKNVRLALSEYVHILNDQNILDEAMFIALDVLERGKLDQGHQYPDWNSVYAMEDVAELCERLARLDDGIKWLQQARNHAQRIWGDHPSTTHINDKLDAMQEKRYNVLASMVSSEVTSAGATLI